MPQSYSTVHVYSTAGVHGANEPGHAMPCNPDYVNIVVIMLNCPDYGPAHY